MAFPNYGYPGYPAYGAEQYPMYMPQQTQTPQTTQNNTQGLSPSSRLVTSREEANAVPADFSGALMVFADITNNKVYTKKLNYQTGAVDFVEYAMTTPEEPKVEQNVPFDEFLALKDVVKKLETKLDSMKKKKAVAYYDDDE